jgi:hypothetical protein
LPIALERVAALSPFQTKVGRPQRVSPDTLANALGYSAMFTSQKAERNEMMPSAMSKHAFGSTLALFLA